MKPFQGYGHFCTNCGHARTVHSVTLHHCSQGQCYESKACVLPDCTCNYYYEGGDA